MSPVRQLLVVPKIKVSKIESKQKQREPEHLAISKTFDHSQSDSKRMDTAQNPYNEQEVTNGSNLASPPKFKLNLE